MKTKLRSGVLFAILIACSAFLVSVAGNGALAQASCNPAVQACS